MTRFSGWKELSGVIQDFTLEGEKLANDLAGAVRRDGAGHEALLELLSTVRSLDERGDRLKVGAVLIGLVRRIESSREAYPGLIRTAAGLADDHPGTEYERALYAANTVIRPLAEAHMRRAG